MQIISLAFYRNQTDTQGFFEISMDDGWSSTDFKLVKIRLAAFLTAFCFVFKHLMFGLQYLRINRYLIPVRKFLELPINVTSCFQRTS